jgi:hypothetical protein
MVIRLVAIHLLAFSVLLALAAPGSSAQAAPATVDLHGGNVFRVDMVYDGTALSWTIIDTGMHATFSASKNVDIPKIVGEATVFVGLTGGTDGETATQDIVTWTFQTPSDKLDLTEHFADKVSLNGSAKNGRRACALDR